MKLINRLETGPRVAVVLLMLGLAAAVTGGILLRPPPAFDYAAVEGHPLLHRSGTGLATAARPIRFGQHAIGIGIRCNGHGSLRVELRPFGAVKSSCLERDTSDSGYVFSTPPPAARPGRLRRVPGTGGAVRRTD